MTMDRKFATLFCALALTATCVSTGAGARADDRAETHSKPAAVADIAKAGGDALVTIKYILKSDEGEDETEVTGVLISSDGLVLSSNFFFGGGPFGGGATPRDIKILHGDDTQGVDARFIARDTELGLAWLRVDNAPSTPYPFVDFTKGKTVALGDEIFAVRKMGKFFGQATSVAQGLVGALVSKPRDLIIPTIGLTTRSELALPVYDASGAPVGVNTFILPEADEMQNAAQTMRGSEHGMILPASDVVEATKKALENAASGASEQPEQPEAAPPAQPAPAAPAQPK